MPSRGIRHPAVKVRPSAIQKPKTLVTVAWRHIRLQGPESVLLPGSPRKRLVSRACLVADAVWRNQLFRQKRTSRTHRGRANLSSLRPCLPIRSCSTDGDLPCPTPEAVP